MHHHVDIVAALGGPVSLSKDLAAMGGEYRPQTIANWSRVGRRIAPEAWPLIAQLPIAQVLGITTEYLAALPRNPPRTP